MSYSYTPWRVTAVRVSACVPKTIYYSGFRDKHEVGAVGFSPRISLTAVSYVTTEPLYETYLP